MSATEDRTFVREVRGHRVEVEVTSGKFVVEVKGRGEIKRASLAAIEREIPRAAGEVVGMELSRFGTIHRPERIEFVGATERREKWSSHVIWRKADGSTVNSDRTPLFVWDDEVAAELTAIAEERAALDRRWAEARARARELRIDDTPWGKAV